MQKPIRYYISKSGDEPTVRSVQVALGPRDTDAGDEPVLAPLEPTKPVAHVTTSATEVKRRVTDAIRGRKPDR